MSKRRSTSSTTTTTATTKPRTPRIQHPRCTECGRIVRPVTDKQRARLEKIAARAKAQADKAAAILAAATRQLAVPGSGLPSEVAPQFAESEVA